jgi:hypothetical protein
MRVLRRQNEADEARAAEAEADAEAAEANAADAEAEAAEAEAKADDTTDGPATNERRTFLPGWRRTETPAATDTGPEIDTAERPAPVVAPAVAVARADEVDEADRVDRIDEADRVDDTVETDTVDERDRTEPGATGRAVTTESEIRTELWSWADAVVSVIGAGLALIGLIVLARAGINRTWYRPVVQVLDADHTAALGAAEVGAGVLLMLAGVARSRAASALVGLAIAIMGALAAIQIDEVRHELAIEEWWAWSLAGVGLLVAVVALVPPRRARVERVLETR